MIKPKTLYFISPFLSCLQRHQKMNATRSALKLHLQNSPIRYHQFFFFSRFNNALIRNPTFSSSSSLFNFNATRFFSVTLPCQTQTQPFVGSAVSSEDFNGRDTFFAEDNVSWSSLGLSHTLSRALSNIALNTPSLVQVTFLSLFSLFLPYLCFFLSFLINPLCSIFDFF